MKMNATINKKAWTIRKAAAKRFSCKVMEISWSECIKIAKENTIAFLDKVTRAYTASTSFEDLLTVNENYNPTLFVAKYPSLLILANAFDKHMKAFGKKNRIYRNYMK